MFRIKTGYLNSGLFNVLQTGSTVFHIVQISTSLFPHWKMFVASLKIKLSKLNKFLPGLSPTKD